ncbi:MAG TPA: acyl-CoA dehydrogenase family protein [Myxococcus sp.]|nr:acyl-CoA dehydrogenase family protein [Myxococcus sp.]
MSAEHVLVLPRLAESLTEARVVAWLVSEGDTVVPGQPVVEVDADKFVVGLEVDQPCIVQRFLQREGAVVPVGETLAWLVPTGASAPAPAVTPAPVAAAPVSPVQVAALVLAAAAPLASASVPSAPVVPAPSVVTPPAVAAPAFAPAPAPTAAQPSGGRPVPPPAGAGGAAAARFDAMQGFQLEPLTAAGKRFCALAEEHARAVAPRAERSDKEGRLAVESYREMQRSGFAAACVPEAFGGLGLDSLHDLTVGVSRLGRADASTAIAMNMHLASVWTLTRYWRAARLANEGAVAVRLEAVLRQIGEGRLLQSVVGSEAGTDILHPLTEARQDTLGWRINGRKIFGTLSEVADVFHITVRVPRPDGGYDTAMVTLPRGAPGLTILNDWDALGMRGSASHSLELKDCFVTDGMMRSHGPWGEWNATLLEAQVSGNIGLLGAYLGVAEAARTLILPSLHKRRKAPADTPLAERAGVQRGVAELEVTLSSARAVLGRIGMLADTFFRGLAPGQADLSSAHLLMKEFQSAKWFVNRKAIEIVDQALQLSGGSGYMASSPLARLYRDVRAGPFMQLFSPNEAFDYIGKVALGLDPVIE